MSILELTAVELGQEDQRQRDHSCRSNKGST